MDILKFCVTRNVKAPTRAHPGDAGIDFYIPWDFEPVHLKHGEAALIPSGIKVDVPMGWALVFMNKSGVASKRKLAVMACVVDHGYTAEVHLNVINNGVAETTLIPGEKLVQGVLLPVGLHEMVETTPDKMWQEVEGARGVGGFGSTGT